MGFFFDQISTILTTPPGNLVYFLVVAFTIAAAFQLSISQWRRSVFPQGRRMVIGFGLLLLVQLLQFVFSALTWQNLVPSHTFLPPLDRAITLITLVVIIWLWVFPEPAPIADVASILLGLLALTFFVLTLAWWGNQPPEVTFNGTLADFGNDLFGLFLLCLGGLLILIRRPNGWGFGLALSVILIAGYLARLWFPQPEGDYSGLIRLAQMMAFPLLLYLPQRFAVPVENGRSIALSVSKEVRRYRVDPALVNEFLSLAANPTVENLGQTISRLISELMVADICLLATPPDASGMIAISCGYDLIRQIPIEGFSLDSRSLPILSSALRRGRFVRLPSSSTSLDLTSLAHALNITRSGHLLAAPVVAQGMQPLMGVILLLPHSNRGWTTDDQNHLVRLCESLALILSQKEELSRLRGEMESKPGSQDEPAPAAGEQAGAQSDLRSQLEQLQEQLEQERSRSASLAQVIASEETYQKKAHQLESELADLRELLRNPPSEGVDETENLNAELRLALEEIARLNNALAEADRKLLALNSGQGKNNAAKPQLEVIASIAQDLRQPLSSIVVYTDLLLGESMGILGATQRKFVERIKASVERMGGLTDDLLQLVMDKQAPELLPEKVNLNEVIDEAVAQAMDQLRQRNIILRLEVPEQLPYLQADRDALLQILVNLLCNASNASPQEGQVALTAQLEAKEGEPVFVLLQVSDSGEGIPAEELSRIFSRLYRAENGLIPGVGDTGVSLAMVKSLVEAHGGRIWVDSTPGKGSTFSVLLPAIDEQIAYQEKG